MRRLGLLLALLAVVGMVPAALANDNHHDRKHHKVKAQLSGFNEVHSASATTPERGAVSTEARGKFRATIDKHDEIIHYTLSYEGLEAEVTQAHIHFGQPFTVGGIVVWLCQTVGTPAPAAVAALTPFCPQEGTVTGTIVPAQVLPQTAQGIDAGEFDEIVRAIKADATYVNVHSTLFPPGEIRGPIDDDKHDHHHHNHHDGHKR